jgi:hypothetical protein
MPSAWMMKVGNLTAEDSVNETRANLEECNAEENKGM